MNPTNEQEIKQLIESLHADCPPACPHTVEPESDWLEKAIQACTNAEIAKVLNAIDKANHAESCVPDCDEVRHARHEGEWAVYSRVDDAIQAERAKLKEVK